MRELWKEEPLPFCAHAGAGPGALWLPARPPSGGSVSCVSPAPRLGRSATFSEAGVSILAAVCGVVALHAQGVRGRRTPFNRQVGSHAKPPLAFRRGPTVRGGLPRWGPPAPAFPALPRR